ncbi:MAG: hypothetical protein AB1578_18885 [Thermodesulfobacteriota bacterium]
MTVERVLVTGEDGVANFGRVGRRLISLTLAWKAEGGYQSEQELRTYVDVPVGEIALVKHPYARSILADESQINVTLSNVPSGAPFVALQPCGWGANGIAEFRGVRVGPEDVQTDGRLSLLATAQGLEVSLFYSPSSYSFLLDEELVYGATYRIPSTEGGAAWRESALQPWETSDETPLLLLDISGFRGGVRYNLGGWYSNTAAVRGSAVFLDEFPVDYYGIYSVSCKAGRGTCTNVHRRVQAMPSVLAVTTPDYGFEYASYDPVTRMIHWSLREATAGYGIQIGHPSTVEPTFWVVWLRPDATSWSIPDLPSPVREWVGDDPFREVALSVLDSSVVEGFDDWWRNYGSRGKALLWEEADTISGHVSLALSQ